MMEEKDIKQIKFYFVATNEVQLKQLQDLGVKNVLVSFLYLKKNKISLDLLRKFESVFLDSGGYTLQKNQSIKIDVKDYLNFINNNKDLFDSAFTLDPKEFNGEENTRNLKILTDNSKISIVPVWHDRDNLSQLREFCEKFSIVGFDSKRVNLLKEIKPKAKIHVLGCSNTELLKKFQFYSCDFSRWCNGGRYGHIYIFRDGRFHKAHYKKDFYKIKLKFEGNLKNLGFSLEDLKSDSLRDSINIKTLLKAESWLNCYYNCNSFSKNQETNRTGPKTEIGKKISSLNSVKTFEHIQPQNLQFLIENSSDEGLKIACKQALESLKYVNETQKRELKNYYIRVKLRNYLLSKGMNVNDAIMDDTFDKLDIKTIGVLEKLKDINRDDKKKES